MQYTTATQKEIASMTGDLVYVARVFKSGVRIAELIGNGLTGTKQEARRFARVYVQEELGEGAELAVELRAARHIGDVLVVSRSLADGFRVQHVVR